MFALSSSDLAIALAIKAGDIRLVERTSRFGGTFIAIEDAVGVIEVQDDMTAATQRVASIRERGAL